MQCGLRLYINRQIILFSASVKYCCCCCVRVRRQCSQYTVLFLYCAKLQTETVNNVDCTTAQGRRGLISHHQASCTRSRAREKPLGSVGYAMLLKCWFIGALWCTDMRTRLRIHRSWVRIWASHIFKSCCISLQQAEITDVVLTGRFSSLPAVVQSASYCPERRIE